MRLRYLYMPMAVLETLAVLERKKRNIDSRKYSKLDPFAATPAAGIVTT